MVDNQANMNKIYQNTTPETPPPRLKAWTINFFRNGTRTLETQLQHIICESIDDESENKSLFVFLMLKIEHETPINSNLYHNECSKSNFSYLALIKQPK